MTRWWEWNGQEPCFHLEPQEGAGGGSWSSHDSRELGLEAQNRSEVSVAPGFLPLAALRPMPVCMADVFFMKNSTLDGKSRRGAVTRYERARWST